MKVETIVNKNYVILMLLLVCPIDVMSLDNLRKSKRLPRNLRELAQSHEEENSTMESPDPIQILREQMEKPFDPQTLHKEAQEELARILRQFKQQQAQKELEIQKPKVKVIASKQQLLDNSTK